MLSLDQIVQTNELVGVEEEVQQLAEWLVRFEQRVIYEQSRKYTNEYNSNKAPSFITGGIVTGLPGTGKTALVQHVAKASGVPFKIIEAPTLFQSLEGESERQFIEHIKQLAIRTSDTSPISLLIIEEIDILSPPLDRNRSDVETRLLHTLFHLMDTGFTILNDHLDASTSNISALFIIGITNRPEALHPELVRSGRLDRRLTMGPRLPEQRQSILLQLTQKLPFTNDKEREILCQEIGKRTHGFVVADLERLCGQVMTNLLRAITKSEGSDIASIADISWWIRALDEIQPANLSSLQTKIPNISLSDIYGLDHVINELRNTVLRPFQHPEHYMQFQVDPPRGLLVHGPPGVGKTMLCCALAREIGINFIWVQGTQIRSMIVGESEQALAQLFARARANAPCILFIDQIDALVPRRGTSSSSENTGDRIVTGFLTEMDGFHTKQRTTTTSSSSRAIDQTVFILAATNRLQSIDPAILRPGRLDQMIGIDMPDTKQRCQILKGKLARIPHCIDSTTIDQWIDTYTEGFTGADLDNLCREAAMQCIRENANEAAFITTDHLQHALTLVSSHSTCT